MQHSSRFRGSWSKKNYKYIKKKKCKVVLVTNGKYYTLMEKCP